MGSIPTDTKLTRAGKASGSSSGSVKPILEGVDRNRTCPPNKEIWFLSLIRQSLRGLSNESVS